MSYREPAPRLPGQPPPLPLPKLKLVFPVAESLASAPTLAVEAQPPFDDELPPWPAGEAFARDERRERPSLTMPGSTAERHVSAKVTVFIVVLSCAALGHYLFIGKAHLGPRRAAHEVARTP